MKSQHRLASEWETCARNYRAQAETLLSNRAEMAEKESLLWRARAYESCAEELRLNEAPQTGNPPPSEAATLKAMRECFQRIEHFAKWGRNLPDSNDLKIALASLDAETRKTIDELNGGNL